MSRPPVLVVHVAKSALEPTYSSLLAAFAAAGLESELLDTTKPLDEQFVGRTVVVDIGGWGREEHIAAGAKAGVALWQVVGYGLDFFALEAALDSGMTIARAPGTTTAIPLAEHAMYLMLAVVKDANAARTAILAERVFNGVCRELAGSTLAILGLGASGRELAKRARGFDMRILGVDVVDLPQGTLDELGVESCVTIDELDSVLAQADFVSLHLPLNAQTHHIINTASLKAMKPGVVIINVARGALVDEAALVEALQSGHVAGAGLDVFESEPLAADSPLVEMPRVVLTPHWAGATMGTVHRRSQVVADNARAALTGQVPAHLVTRADL
jgi:phosphoglycerate dehydrogenase-like enzyme